MFKERELALKFFSTLSGVKTDKLDLVGQKFNHDHTEGNCEIWDSGRIEDTLEALARYVKVKKIQGISRTLSSANYTIT